MHGHKAGRGSLIDQGIKQGSIISCRNLSQKLKETIQEGRSVSGYRKRPIQKDHCLLVLSQDCDINSPHDRYIEILVIKKLPKKKLDVKLQDNRSYRKLQLPIGDDYWLCQTELISVIPKEGLTKKKLDLKDLLDERSHRILLDWRVDRYKRIPFPDKFNKEFNKYLKDPDSRFGEFLQENKEDIADLYVYVDPQGEDAKEYRVSVTALLEEDCTEDKKEHIQNELLQHWRHLHEDARNSLKMIQADKSYAPNNLDVPVNLVLYPSDFTLSYGQKLRRYTVNYLCY